jgi:hypothetical protein
MVVQRRDQLIADAVTDRVVLDVRARRQIGEVAHDKRPTLMHRVREHGSLEVRGPVVRGVGEDAGLLVTRAVVEQQHAVAIDGGQAQQQFGTAEQGAQAVLQPEEAMVRDDGLAVDKIALERREHLLVGDLHGAEDREAADDESLRRQDPAQPGGIEHVRLQVLAHFVG